MTRAYYNENDPDAARWLESLIAAGHIAFGDVDRRSIVDVRPSDLSGYSQCHFFAGIGGWSYALRLAGVDDAEPVWTGSCPCQPFSAAGKQRGTEDDRHLWPVFAKLIEARRPATVFGEQVASKLGRDWLSGVRADVEGMGYEFGGADLCAASVGAPHIRQRLYWVANSDDDGREGVAELRIQRTDVHDVDGRGTVRRVERSASNGRVARRTESSGRGAIGGCGAMLGMGDADDARSQGRFVRRDGSGQRASRTPGMVDWREARWIECRDGKARPIEPGSFPLAHGIPARVGRLRGYGNAIVPQVAAAFVRSFRECRP